MYSSKVYQIEEIKEILNKYRDLLDSDYYVSKLMIFGSYARGEQTSESDIDLLIETKKPLSMFKFVQLINYLEEILEKKVDLGTIKSLKPVIKDEILNEAISL